MFLLAVAFSISGNIGPDYARKIATCLYSKYNSSSDSIRVTIDYVAKLNSWLQQLSLPELKTEQQADHAAHPELFHPIYAVSRYRQELETFGFDTNIFTNREHTYNFITVLRLILLDTLGWVMTLASIMSARSPVLLFTEHTHAHRSRYN